MEAVKFPVPVRHVHRELFTTELGLRQNHIRHSEPCIGGRNQITHAIVLQELDLWDIEAVQIHADATVSTATVAVQALIATTLQHAVAFALATLWPRVAQRSEFNE